MKAQFCILIWSFFLVLTQGAFAQCRSCNSIGESLENGEEKIYLASSQIALHDSKIYVQLEEHVFVVPAIYSDQQGFYIQPAQGRCELFEWKCKWCGKCNDLSEYICWNCKRDME